MSSWKDRTIPWNEFEPRLIKLQKLCGNCSIEAVMQMLGYAGGTHVNSWKKRGVVPILAVNALNWIEYDLDPGSNHVAVFTSDELSRLFALCNGIPIPEDQRKQLISKVAVEIAR